MVGVKLQVTAGMSAWIVGATAATGLSLFAISHLGSDVSGTQGTMLSSQDVDRALINAASATPSDSPSGDPGQTPSSAGPTPAGPTGTPIPDSSRPRTSAPSPSSPPSVVWSARRTLSGYGGQVVAQCLGHQAYLDTWTPAQGYQVGSVQRGPARFAMVAFDPDGPLRPVPMYVVCPNGIPVVAVDDSGYDH